MTNKQEEKSGVQKLRERFWNIKKSIKPSKELIETLKEYKRRHEQEKEQKKVARPHSPEAGA